MWADSLNNGTYKLDNVPLFAYGVNLHDVFAAVKRGRGPDPAPQNSGAVSIFRYRVLLRRTARKRARCTLFVALLSQEPFPPELGNAALRSDFLSG